LQEGGKIDIFDQHPMKMFSKNPQKTSFPGP